MGVWGGGVRIRHPLQVIILIVILITIVIIISPHLQDPEIPFLRLVNGLEFSLSLSVISHLSCHKVSGFPEITFIYFFHSFLWIIPILAVSIVEHIRPNFDIFASYNPSFELMPHPTTVNIHSALLLCSILLLLESYGILWRIVRIPGGILILSLFVHILLEFRLKLRRYTLCAVYITFW